MAIMYNAYASFEFIFILLAMPYSLRVTSYNCGNLKSSIENVRQLCDTHDIIFLQETWLSNDELSILKCLRADFYADGVSAMDTTSGILIGRPFGCIGILWRKSIGACIQVHISTILESWELNLIMAIAIFSPLIYIYLMTTGLGTAKIMTNLWATRGWFILLSKSVTFLVSM